MYASLHVILTILSHTLTCSGAEWTENIGNVTVSFDKGAITVNNDINSLTLAFKQVKELAENSETKVGVEVSGRERHDFDNFEGQNYKISPGEIVEVAGRDLGLNEDKNVTAFRKTFSATLIGPNLKFFIQMFVYKNDTIIVNDENGERFQVNNGTVKVTSTLEWKFCGHESQCEKNGVKETGEILDFFVQVSGTVLREPFMSEIRASNFKGMRPPKTFNYGGSDITVSKKYIQNMTSLEYPANYPKLVYEKDKQYIAMRFARFPYKFPVTSSFYIHLQSTKYTPSTGTYVRNSSVLLLILSVFTILKTSIVW